MRFFMKRNYKKLKKLLKNELWKKLLGKIKINISLNGEVILII